MSNVEVLCEVDNCVHNIEGIHCGADTIRIMSEVGNKAHSNEETDCQTFEPDVQ